MLSFFSKTTLNFSSLKTISSGVPAARSPKSRQRLQLSEIDASTPEAPLFLPDVRLYSQSVPSILFSPTSLYSINFKHSTSLTVQ